MLLTPTTAFGSSLSVAAGPNGVLYVADTNNHYIGKIDTAQNTFVVFAGAKGTSGYVDAVGTTARFNSPSGVAVDSSGIVYIADTANFRIRRIGLDMNVTTVAGNSNSAVTDGLNLASTFLSPTIMSIDSSDFLYVVDNVSGSASNLIRRIIVTVCPSGTHFASLLCLNPVAYNETKTMNRNTKSSFILNSTTFATDGTNLITNYLLTLPQNGSLYVNNSLLVIGSSITSTDTVSYAPFRNYNGTDSFKYYGLANTYA